MLCNECGHLLPDARNDSTICSKCRTPLATWWDESSGTKRVNRESLLPDDLAENYASAGNMKYSGAARGMAVERPGHGSGFMEQRPRNTDSMEERNFQGALIILEGHFERPQNYMAKSMAEVKIMVAKVLDQSLNKADVREILAKNVTIWMRYQRIFSFAIPLLDRRSLSSTQDDQVAPTGQEVPESASLILKNYEILKEDLYYLNNLLVISRNMLAVKETAQEICKAVGFDKEVAKLIELCVGVTSKGYDGENVPDGDRGKLVEITELYKKLLVTSLQHTHNWTMANDRFKMSFWFDMLFDEEQQSVSAVDGSDDHIRVLQVYAEVKNWLKRRSKKDKVAATLLEKYSSELRWGHLPGPLPAPEEDDIDRGITEESITPIWKPELAEDKYEQDRLYARVSHEIDVWWKRVRDANYEGWVVQMETVEGAEQKAAACRENAMHRYMPRVQDHDSYLPCERYDAHHGDTTIDQSDTDDHSIRDDHGEDDGDDDEEDDEDDDDDSYVEGPLRGLLTEIPNILDTKQIEALHMTVKACIVDSMGSGLTLAGENLQKTRCKMFLALDCGKNLLREMLVFIAVWEQTDQQFIFQITAQIIESFHHNALLPYAWDSLRILKDIVSPAQTVLLRLINYMFRARKDSPIYDDLRDYNRDAKLIHFLYNYFRCRVVPDCVALIHAQAQIRHNNKHPSDFPVDLWDMERAKDGLSQYLDFISVIAEIPEMRPLLIEWETVYEMITLLKALDHGVARKTLDDERAVPGPSRRQVPAPGTTPNVERPYDDQNPLPATSEPQVIPPSVPPLHDTPHRYPWSGIKIQILIILTSLLAPSNARRTGPGNPIVQKQILARDGIMPLLNCCVYDGHNEYLKERATLAIKFCMEGNIEAQNFVKDLVPVKQAQAKAQAAAEKQLAKGDPDPGSLKGKDNVELGKELSAAEAQLKAQEHVLGGDPEAVRILEETRKAMERMELAKKEAGAIGNSSTRKK